MTICDKLIAVVKNELLGTKC